MMSPAADSDRATASMVQAGRLRGRPRRRPTIAATAPLVFTSGKIQLVSWLCGSTMEPIAATVPASRNHNQTRLGFGAADDSGITAPDTAGRTTHQSAHRAGT